MAKKKPRPVAVARQSALECDVDAALPLLAECAAAGDDSAAASLAELLAFLWRWEEVIPNAARLIANPFAVFTGNVFNDMVRLLGRAGRQTGAWERISEAAVAGRRQVEQKLRANDMRYPPVKVQAERTRLGGILDRLAEYAAGRGQPPHELVGIFVPASSPNEAGYQVALERNKGKPAARLLSLAIAFGVDAEAIRLYPQAEEEVAFDDAVSVARALVRSQEPARAWRVVAGKLPSWSPVDAAQVAPVVLLVDDYLSGIVTAERAAEVVRTRRAGRA